MEIVPRNINDLIPAEYNPRQLTDNQAEQIKGSLQRFGFVDPVIVNKHPDRDNIIVGGHMRIRCARELGIEEVPTVEVSLDADKERELNVRLNKNSGSWDFDVLANEFDVEDLVEWGFDEGDLTGFDVDTGEAEEVEAAEPPEDPKTELGRIYQLGRHRLMCGDSTSEEDVGRLMDGEKADMVFTDPPYGMFLDADFSDMDSKFKGSDGGNKYEKVIGDNEDFKPELIQTVFDNFGYCKEVFLWGADYYAEILQSKNEGSWVVWDKRGGESADKMYGSCFELCWSKARHKRDIARVKWAGIFGMEKEHDKKRVHPTQKPALLATWFFNRWGAVGDIVADLFGGSGSTLIACEQLNRSCRMMELDPSYCDVIVKRYAECVGTDADEIFKTGFHDA